MVADSLDELSGPVCGVVELPLHLDWSEQRRYTLDDVRELSVMYERVLREAQDYAVQAHGFVQRRSEDVDLFATAESNRQDLWIKIFRRRWVGRVRRGVRPARR